MYYRNTINFYHLSFESKPTFLECRLMVFFFLLSQKQALFLLQLVADISAAVVLYRWNWHLWLLKPLLYKTAFSLAYMLPSFNFLA